MQSRDRVTRREKMPIPHQRRTKGVRSCTSYIYFVALISAILQTLLKGVPERITNAEYGENESAPLAGDKTGINRT